MIKGCVGVGLGGGGLKSQMGFGWGLNEVWVGLDGVGWDWMELGGVG